MIRIDRGPEPAELAKARRQRLARAVLARRIGKKIEMEGYNLSSVRHRLHKAQHAKCVYCERSIGKAGQPIEHFRPKQEADRGNPFTGEHAIREDRYWWLAWSWNNLLLSCSTCNSPMFKGNWFPLEPGSPELVVPDGLIRDDHPCFAVGLERALLINPAWDDPLDHITWLPLYRDDPYKAWRAYHRTDRGHFTIHILGLDGRNVDRADAHVRHNVKQWVDRVHEALETSELEAARVLWGQALACLFAPSQLFHALSHDALAYLVPNDVRAHAGLALPRPGAPPPIHSERTTPPGGTATAPLASHADLPDDVILHLLADEKSTPELILLVCQVRPSTLDELATLLDLGNQTVRGHCKNLTDHGELTVDENGRYSLATPGAPGT